MAKQFPIELYLQAMQPRTPDAAYLSQAIGNVATGIKENKKLQEAKALKEKEFNLIKDKNDMSTKVDILNAYIKAGKVPQGDIGGYLKGTSTDLSFVDKTSDTIDMPVYAKKGDKLELAIDPLTNKPLIDKGVKKGTPARVIPYDTQASQEDRRLSQAKSIVDRFNQDASVKKAQQSTDAVNTIRGLVYSDNPISHNAIPTYMARASGEVGNLSEPDKKPFGGSQAFDMKMKQMASNAIKGKLTPENKDFILGVVDVMERKSQENLDKIARLRANQYGNIKGHPYGTADEIYEYIRPTYKTPKTDDNSSGTTSTNIKWEIIP